MRSHKSIRSRLFALIANPIATVLLATLLVADYASMPKGPWWKDARSSLATAISDTLEPQARLEIAPLSALEYPTEAHAVRENDTIILIDPERESWDRLGSRLQVNPEDVLTLLYRPERQTRGLWAMTTTTETHRISVVRGESFTDEEIEEAKGLFLPLIEDRWGAREALLAAAGHVERRILWTGYLHNALSLTALVLLLVSLAWVPRAPAWIRARFTTRALSQGKCPSCGYDISAIAHHTCPECGRPLPSLPITRRRTVNRGEAEAASHTP